MNEIIIQTSDAQILQDRIMDAVATGKYKFWSLGDKSIKNSLTHSSTWGKKGLLYMEVNPNNVRELNVTVAKLPKVRKDLNALSGTYLSRFFELLLSDFGEDFISVLPVRQ